MVLFFSVSAWLLLLGIPLYGLRRGGGQVIAMGGCILLSGVLMRLLAPVCAGWVQLGHRPGTDAAVGLWQLWLYLLFLVLSIVLGAYLTRFLDWSFDPFDAVVGGLFGIVVAVIAARLFLSALIMAYDGLPEQQLVEQMFLTRQLVFAEGWHAINTWMAGLTNPPEVELNLPQR